jgi:NitT/TauT family transport system substrate-binding protein
MPKTNSGKNLVITAVKILLLASIYLGIVSCDGQGSRGELKTPLKVGTNVWPGYEPLYLAREKKFYDESAIRLVEYSNSTEVLRAFRNGTIHVAALTLDEVLLLWENDFKAHAFLVMDISDGGDVIISTPEIGDMKALKGKRIGAENTALGAYILTRALQLSGLTSNDAQIIYSKIDEHEKMFAEGKFDAVVTFEPISTRLLEKGAKQIFDTTQIPGEVVDVLVIRDDWIKEFGPALDTLVKGWFKSLHLISTNPDEAHQIISKRMKISQQEVANSYRGLKLPSLKDNIQMLGTQEPSLLRTVAKLYSIMQESKLLKKEFDTKSIIYKIDLMNATN